MKTSGLGRASRAAKLARARWLGVLGASFAAVAMGGCAIHPVQQDVTGLPTKRIVDRIRCEARLAVVDKAIALLRAKATEWESDADYPPNVRYAPQLRKDARKLRDVADGLFESRGRPIKFNPSVLPPGEAITFYNRYINTVIAYDFSFNVTEENKVSAAVDPLRLITGGMVGGGLSASSELTRNNVRTFKLSDDFGELLRNTDLVCESLDYLPGNYAYPITGSIGLQDIVHNFIDLNEARPLVASGSGTNAFADALTFTTELISAATPRVQIAAVGNRIGYGTPTNFGLGAQRKDVHKVTIGLAIGTVGAATAFVGARGVVVQVQPVAGESPGAAANRARAFKAIEDQRLNNFLDRAGEFFR